VDSPISRVAIISKNAIDGQSGQLRRKLQKLAAALGVTQVIGCDVLGTAMDLPPGTELHRGQVDVLQVPGTGIANEIS